MRLSRWGRSEYETDAHLVAERAALAPHVTVLEPGADAEIVVVTSKERLGAELRQRAPSARLLLTTTSGADHLDLPALAALGVVAGRTPEARRDAVAETTLGLLLDGLRAHGALRAAAREGRWARRELPSLGMRLLRDQPVGLVGLGVIGRRVASLLQAFGARVLGDDPAGLPPGVEPCPVEGMLQRCSAITLHCDLNDRSRGLISRATLDAARPGLVLVNTARGESVDVPAAIEALEAGHLAYLGLDVFATEPWPGMARSADLPGLVLLPHAAGYHEGLAAAVSAGLVASVSAYVAGRPLPYPLGGGRWTGGRHDEGSPGDGGGGRLG